ncbi:hypothetical protein L596_009231 [Steinernema carpocapsae]|uniref:SH2 domain-containing protein n=2 Tax=Steinernema carpocapsae TaxID=34508 RepID=A0A4U5PEQ9_STECR|nr:hypothetical protein L596_009231 [Steinernema carpocapsae]
MRDQRVRCDCCAKCTQNCFGMFEKTPSRYVRQEISSSIYEEVNTSKKLKHIPHKKIACATLTSEATSARKPSTKSKKGDEVTLVRDVYPEVRSGRNSPASEPSPGSQSSSIDEPQFKRLDSRREKRSLWSLNDSLIRERLFVVAKKKTEPEEEYESVDEMDKRKMKHICFRNGRVVNSRKEPKASEKNQSEQPENEDEVLTAQDLRQIRSVESAEKDRKKGRRHRDRRGEVEKKAERKEKRDQEKKRRKKTSEHEREDSYRDDKRPVKPRSRKKYEEEPKDDSRSHRERENRSLWSLLEPTDLHESLHERGPNLSSASTEYENVGRLTDRDERLESESDVIGKAEGHFYLGAQRKESAERRCRRRQSFRFYHRVPSKSFLYDYTLIPVNLILWMVYRSCKGYHRHFPMMKAQAKGSKTEKWAVGNWPNSLLEFEKLNDLIKHYLKNPKQLDDSA